MSVFSILAEPFKLLHVSRQIRSNFNVIVSLLGIAITALVTSLYLPRRK